MNLHILGVMTVATVFDQNDYKLLMALLLLSKTKEESEVLKHFLKMINFQKEIVN
jgi:hypothetical protein